ncbi:MAG TPA: hypothetical protein EYG54_10670 [Myxococcales bacterium]|nr:hypothetical protein [Myxococcales bacterium]
MRVERYGGRFESKFLTDSLLFVYRLDAHAARKPRLAFYHIRDFATFGGLRHGLVPKVEPDPPLLETDAIAENVCPCEHSVLPVDDDMISILHADALRSAQIPMDRT